MTSRLVTGEDTEQLIRIAQMLPEPGMRTQI